MSFEDVMIMIIAHNSCAPKGKKERGRGRGNMEEFVERRRGMLTTGEWCNPVRNMLHHV